MFSVQILHENIYDNVMDKLKKAYSKIPIGDPLDGEQYIDIFAHNLK